MKLVRRTWFYMSTQARGCGLKCDFLSFFLLTLLLLSNSRLLAISVVDVVKKTGISGGFCAFPLADGADAALAMGLAQQPSFVVHMQAASAANAMRLRAAADTAGLLGRSLYVEQGTLRALPYADRFVDLLVADTLRDDDLTPELRTACLRVLSPGRGTALLGCDRSAGRGLTKKALQAWVGDLPLTTVQEDDSGLWVVLRTRLPAGSDAWTHRLHGPESSQVSQDTALQAPFLTQWWGLPRMEGFWGTTVVACNGRLFTIGTSHFTWNQVSLTARSLNNGVVLWQRDLSNIGTGEKRVHYGGLIPGHGFVSGRSCIAAAPDSIYLAASNSVLRLDAETGAVRSRIEGPASDGQVKWLALSGKLLAMMVGDKDLVTNLMYQTVAGNPVGRALAVYDTETSQELWHETVPGDIDERMIVVRDQQLYCLVQGVGMTCRDLRDGKMRWVNADTNLQAEYESPKSRAIQSYLVSLPVLSALPDVLILRAKWTTNTIVLARKDGALLWRKPTVGGSYRALTACAANNVWIGGGKQPLELQTGNITNGPTFISSGCGATISTPDYLFSCFGKVTDLHSNKVIRIEDLKSPCDLGTIVSDGLMINAPSECGCYFELKGYRVLASAGTIKPHTAPAWSERLTIYDTAEPASLPSTAADWTTYRHDAQRSGASAATVGLASNVLWQWKAPGGAPYTNPPAFHLGQSLKPDFLTTAPVAADGWIWFGSPDGVVRCLKADSGQEVWHFATRGMLFKPPTLWQGRLLAGGGDGRIYCLEAKTGKCLWQFLAAPVDRRVFWFGHLVSTWPVLTGVVVQDGVAYAVAGYQKENGVHAYALDPKSGQMVWENDKAGSGGVWGPGWGPEVGLSCGGGLAVGEGRVWMPSGCFEMKTGAARSIPGLEHADDGYFSKDVGVFSKWVVRGGRRISETEDMIEKPLSRSGFSLDGMDAKDGRIPDLGSSMPAWDANHLLLPPRNTGGSLTLVPTAAFVTWATNYPAAKAAFDKAPKDAKPKLANGLELKLWATDNITPAAFALTKDQAVVTYAESGKYKVSGYLREDGKKVWTANLPEQPIMNSLAVDRDGHVIVALCDGSVICLGVCRN